MPLWGHQTPYNGHNPPSGTCTPDRPRIARNGRSAAVLSVRTPAYPPRYGVPRCTPRPSERVRPVGTPPNPPGCTPYPRPDCPRQWSQYWGVAHLLRFVVRYPRSMTATGDRPPQRTRSPGHSPQGSRPNRTERTQTPPPARGERGDGATTPRSGQPGRPFPTIGRMTPRSVRG